jgi:hypothetical protein
MDVYRTASEGGERIADKYSEQGRKNIFGDNHKYETKNRTAQFFYVCKVSILNSMPYSLDEWGHDTAGEIL